VVWGPFVSASSSRLTLADLLSKLPLRGVSRDLSLGSGLTANRINLPYASELYPASDSVSSVLLDQRFAIDPCLPSFPSFDEKVTSLEPRTPHQPEKLKKLSKNDPVVPDLEIESTKNTRL